MLAHYENYNVSRATCQAVGVTDVPYGGLNMIFAGDFAQQPPVVGGEEGSLYSRKAGQYGADARSQKAALGKAIWHLFVVVVLLKQNHRQSATSADDLEFQDCMMRMRLKVCTTKNLTWIDSRCAFSSTTDLSIADELFRNVSVITARNIVKDAINDIGVRRFATESGQELIEFFSEDWLRVKGQQDRPLSAFLQHELWEQPHSFCKSYVPGKLSLCRGMPVMLRYNSATELSMTKGQEGIVYDWQESRGSRGQRMLDVLFVELVTPPRPVQFPGLPRNVVPITRQKMTVECMLPRVTTGSKYITIVRDQVHVLPNFSMTDYASQGKSREVNVVDLQDCADHHAYYVA
ncbi:uncharacterized protein SCHCODRAFT_02480463, partial [Schizophyllum commune H4-8]|uniref:uncharacterized protein n=1 Tax=Schizophyllum commune (strain H4-8 / FGSC 9210) TaxID=578458 RepID=UPI00215FF466